MNSKKSIKSGYYDNPDRFIIGLSIATHMDLFEVNYEEYTGGKKFNWDKDGDIFNRMSDELDRIVENNIAQKLGHTAVEEYHAGNDYAISTYEVSFWGYRNQPEDMQVLKNISKYADDNWSDNGRITYAYYDTNFYAGDINSFLDRWGEKGDIYGVMAEALANAITIAIDFPEDLIDSDLVMNSRKPVKSSHKLVKSGFDITPEQNKFNWAYNDWYGHFHMNLDRVPQYLEGVKWCDANKGSEFYNELCEKYNIYPTGDRERAAFYNALKELGEIESVTSSRKSIKSSRKTIPGLKFNSDDKSGNEYLVQYKVEDNELLDKIKDYLYYDVDDKTVLQPGNVFVGFMYDKDGSSLLAAQVVDTESSIWDLSPEECEEIFGQDINRKGINQSRVIKSSAENSNTEQILEALSGRYFPLNGNHTRTCFFNKTNGTWFLRLDSAYNVNQSPDIGGKIEINRDGSITINGYTTYGEVVISPDCDYARRNIVLRPVSVTITKDELEAVKNNDYGDRSYGSISPYDNFYHKIRDFFRG